LPKKEISHVAAITHKVQLTSFLFALDVFEHVKCLALLNTIGLATVPLVQNIFAVVEDEHVTFVQ
jgi:hypothetical protein